MREDRYATMDEWRAATEVWRRRRPVYAPRDCAQCGKMEMEPEMMPAFKRVDLSEFCECAANE